MDWRSVDHLTSTQDLEPLSGPALSLISSIPASSFCWTFSDGVGLSSWSSYSMWRWTIYLDVALTGDASWNLTSRATMILLVFCHQAASVSLPHPARKLFRLDRPAASFLLRNMHVGLASVNPETRYVRFLTKPQFKRRRFLGTCKMIVDVAYSTHGYCRKV